jgi:hypothetical protein
MSKISKRNEDMIRRGYWPGDREFVIGTYDENGKVVKEYRIPPGGRMPVEALRLWQQAIQRGDEVLEVDRGDAEYDRAQVEQAAKKKPA